MIGCPSLRGNLLLVLRAVLSIENVSAIAAGDSKAKETMPKDIVLIIFVAVWMFLLVIVLFDRVQMILEENWWCFGFDRKLNNIVSSLLTVFRQTQN